MISFTALQQALLDAQARVYQAQLADEANVLLNHEHSYSQAYARAYRHWLQVYHQWREVYEQVCFPLTAIGVLYDPTIEFVYDDETDTPTVKMAAIRMGTAKLPVVHFPKVAA